MYHSLNKKKKKTFLNILLLVLHSSFWYFDPRLFFIVFKRDTNNLIFLLFSLYYPYFDDNSITIILILCKCPCTTEENRKHYKISAFADLKGTNSLFPIFLSIILWNQYKNKMFINTSMYICIITWKYFSVGILILARKISRDFLLLNPSCYE